MAILTLRASRPSPDLPTTTRCGMRVQTQTATCARMATVAGRGFCTVNCSSIVWTCIASLAGFRRTPPCATGCATGSCVVALRSSRMQRSAPTVWPDDALWRFCGWTKSHVHVGETRRWMRLCDTNELAGHACRMSVVHDSCTVTCIASLLKGLRGLSHVGSVVMRDSSGLRLRANNLR